MTSQTYSKTELDSLLAGKADDTAIPTLAAVATTGAYSDLTGTPTIPATPADIGAEAAGTAAAAVAALVNGASTALDTLSEIDAQLAADEGSAAALTTLVGTKAPTASPAFTGTPTAPTAPTGTSTTQIATTAFVAARASSLSAADYGLATGATGAANSAALVAAWNAGKTLGLPVRVPPGAYPLAATTLTAYDAAHLFGSGAGFDDPGRLTSQFISTETGGADLLTINTGGASTKAWNVVLEDFELTGTGTDGTGLRVGDLTGVIGPYTVRRVTAHNFGSAGFTINGKLDHGYWEACVARNNPVGYDQGGAGNKFVSETTYVACHGSFNTQYGWKIRSSSSATNLTGCESSSNSVAGLWIGSQSTAPHYVRIQGHHAENNTTYAADIANSTASCTVVFDGLRVMDSSASGIAAAINVAAQFQVHIQNCYFELKNANAVGVKEAAGSFVTYGEHNLVLNFTGTNTLYLRQDPNGVLTNYRHGFAKKATDQVVTNSTVAVADTDLKVYVPGAGTYIVDLFLIYDASTAGDILTSWAAPTGATMDWASGGLSSGTTSGTTAIVANAFGISSTGASGGVNVGTKVIMRPQGLLTMGTTGGTLGLQWAQLAADATNLTVHAGSWLRLTRVD